MKQLDQWKKHKIDTLLPNKYKSEHRKWFAQRFLFCPSNSTPASINQRIWALRQLCWSQHGVHTASFRKRFNTPVLRNTGRVKNNTFNQSRIKQGSWYSSLYDKTGGKKMLYAVIKLDSSRKTMVGGGVWRVHPSYLLTCFGRKKLCVCRLLPHLVEGLDHLTRPGTKHIHKTVDLVWACLTQYWL